MIRHRKLSYVNPQVIGVAQVINKKGGDVMFTKEDEEVPVFGCACVVGLGMHALIFHGLRK
jgi:hypothetical protein